MKTALEMERRIELISKEIERMIVKAEDDTSLNVNYRDGLIDAYRNVIELMSMKEKLHSEDIDMCDLLRGLPRETLLFSKMHGFVWLAEVDTANGIITCYTSPLDEGDTRSSIEQENTVSFFSNGKTGDEDFNVTKDRQLFLITELTDPSLHPYVDRHSKQQFHKKPIENGKKCVPNDVFTYRLSLTRGIDLDDVTVYIKPFPEPWEEGYDESKDMTLNERKDFVMEKYFTKKRIEELKWKLIEKIMSEENPFDIYCVDVDGGYNVTADQLVDL